LFRLQVQARLKHQNSGADIAGDVGQQWPVIARRHRVELRVVESIGGCRTEMEAEALGERKVFCTARSM
jgi:hypothetical protein